MASSPPTGSDIGGTFARVQKSAVTWLAVFAPVTLLYLGGVFYFAREQRGASALLGLAPASAEALLVDLVIAVAPLCILISGYLAFLARRRLARRKVFLATHENDDLVVSTRYPALIYAREAAHLRLLWNADGYVEDGALYPLPPHDAIAPLDPLHFLAQGTP